MARRPRFPSVHPINPLHHLKTMGRIVRPSSKKPGSAPGSLVAPSGPPKVERVRLRFLDYDSENLNDNETATLQECLKIKDSPTVTWINVDGLHDVEVVQTLGEGFGWHPLVMEDILSPGQRPKFEEFDGYVYIVLPMLQWDPEGRHVIDEQLSLVVGDRYVVSFQERYGDVFEGVRERIRGAAGRLRHRGADYLTYALMDAVVDYYFHVLEAVGDLTEGIEEEVLVDPRQGTMGVLHALKRELITVRRAVWPVREVLGTLHRLEEGPFKEETRMFLRDVYDHAIQVLDAVETLRDVVSGTVDLYLSTVSFRTNEIMKVLTIVGSIFIPLTFFAGIYGMNFDHMPELHARWGYPVLIGLMLVVAGVMLAYFRKRDWI